ncbi:hypothetical protein L3V59_26935 [Burkholderia aenigmatica]|uniref:hypothetical protein n=1 Tax=Burkholderia aenigmatica TaxID=2015348 RepID=UPI001F28A456|nr:hypothetical protein [Burkholderia aenigmatica]UKD13354.1 hypothetical protein L3V59_26935 [Burkholderia aenigmatica]
MPAREVPRSLAASPTATASRPACPALKIGRRTSFDHRSIQFSRFKRIIKFLNRIEQP